VPVGPWQPNLVLYDWATILCELLRGSPDGKSYRLGAAYIEFENNSGAVVTPPGYDRTGNLSYYSGLNVHATRDYLRVLHVLAEMSSTNETQFPRGNQLLLKFATEGTMGVHGKPFSDGSSSRVFGVALAAAPGGVADPSQDLVFSRTYFDGSAQQVKPAGGGLSFDWVIPFN